MREEETQKAVPAADVMRETAHPWVDLPVEDDSLDETLRYTLDEIRFA